MKYLALMVACLAVFSLRAQTFVVENQTLYEKSRGRVNTLGIIMIEEAQPNTLVQVTLIHAPDDELMDRIMVFVRDEFGQSAQVSFKRMQGPEFDYSPDEGYLSSKQHQFNQRPALWRAGQHKLNALGWILGGGVGSTAAVLIGQPVIGGAILVVSGIATIVETVKSANALKEAAADAAD
jgi:hypothetical protein